MIARLMPVFIFFALVLVMLVLLTREDTQTASTAVRPAPAVELKDVDGKSVTLPKGEYVIVNFFASWCVPCVLEHPQLMELKSKAPIIGINYRDQQQNIQAMLKSRGNPYAAVAIDGKGEAALAFGIAGVPETFLIDPAGNIVWHASGPVMAGELDELKARIDAR